MLPVFKVNRSGEGGIARENDSLSRTVFTMIHFYPDTEWYNLDLYGASVDRFHAVVTILAILEFDEDVWACFLRRYCFLPHETENLLLARILMSKEITRSLDSTFSYMVNILYYT